MPTGAPDGKGWLSSPAFKRSNASFRAGAAKDVAKAQPTIESKVVTVQDLKQRLSELQAARDGRRGTKGHDQGQPSREPETRQQVEARRAVEAMFANKLASSALGSVLCDSTRSAANRTWGTEGDAERARSMRRMRSQSPRDKFRRRQVPISGTATPASASSRSRRGSFSSEASCAATISSQASCAAMMMMIVIYCSFSETNRANFIYFSTR